MNAQNRFIHKQPKYPSKSQQKTGDVATQWNATHQWKKKWTSGSFPRLHLKSMLSEGNQIQNNYMLYGFIHMNFCEEQLQGNKGAHREINQELWWSRWKSLNQGGCKDVENWSSSENISKKKKKSRCRFLKNLMQYARSKELALTGSEQKERWFFVDFNGEADGWCRLGEGLMRLARVQSEMPTRGLNKGSKQTTGCAR